MWRTVESLIELKEDLRVNGFQSPVTLAIDPVSFRCNLQDGNHRIACPTELNLMWIPVRVLRLSYGLANNYLKVPKIPESFPNLPCPCKFGFTTFRDKAKTIVSIAKVSEKLTHVLKLLGLVCPKHMQFRFKGKSFIIKTFHHLKFRGPKSNLVINA